MIRKVVVLALLVLCSLSAFARSRGLSHREIVPQGGTVSGIVERVDGNFVHLADGLIAVDASEARVVIGRGRESSVAQIEPGMLLFASIGKNGKATTITASHLGDATLTGLVESVDVSARSLVLLGETIYVDDDTSFGGYRKDEGLDLSDILPNQLVQVQVDAVNARLIASEILVLAPVPPQIHVFRGTVKTIGTESWEFDRDGEVVTVIVNAQTKIVGSPKVGDTVEVIYNTDSANNKVAVSIIKFQPFPPPPRIVHFHGGVKSITGNTWVVTVDSLGDKTFTVNDKTKITPDTGVGNLVQVMAMQADDGALTAIAIIRLRL